MAALLLSNYQLLLIMVAMKHFYYSPLPLSLAFSLSHHTRKHTNAHSPPSLSTLSLSLSLSLSLLSLSPSPSLSRHTRKHTAMPKDVKKAKIACLNFSLQKAKMALGVQVVVEDPEKLEAIRQRLGC